MKHKWRYYLMGMMLLHVEELHVEGSSLLEWLECFNRIIEHVPIIFAAQRGWYVLYIRMRSMVGEEGWRRQQRYWICKRIT